MNLLRFKAWLDHYLKRGDSYEISRGVRIRTQTQQLVDLNAGASIVNAFPANCIPLGASARVDTAVVTTTGDDDDSWKLGLSRSFTERRVRRRTVSYTLADLSAAATQVIVGEGERPISIMVRVDSDITTNDDANDNFQIGTAGDPDAILGLTDGATAGAVYSQTEWTADPSSLFSTSGGVTLVFDAEGADAFTAGAVTILVTYETVDQGWLAECFGGDMSAEAGTILDGDDWQVNPVSLQHSEAQDLVVAPDNGATFDSGAITVQWSYLEYAPITADD